MIAVSCRRIGFAAAALVAVILLPSCESKITDVPVEVTQVDVSAPRTTLNVGESVQLSATPRSADGDGLTARPVTYSTNAPNVAEVSGTGLVTGMGAGTAIITASSGAGSGSVNITVVLPPRIALAPTTIDFNALQGGPDPGSQTVTISNSGGGSLTGITVGTIQYTGGTGGWLQITQSGSTATATLTLTASAQGRAPGTYVATVPITSTVASNSPQQLTVRLIVAPSFTLTVVSGGTGSGTVAGGGINCTVTNGTASGQCTARFAANATANLTATPISGHTFAGFSGACTTTASTCAITMSADRTVTATFNQPTATLTITGTGSGNGIVTGPGGVNCTITAGVASGTCQVAFPLNSSVTLTATASTVPGHTFAGWSNACTGTGTCVVQMSAARTVTANFNRIPASPVVTTEPADSISTTTGKILGRVIQDGSPYTLWFEFGTSPTLATFQVTSSGSGPTANCPGTTTCLWSTTLTQLTPGTTYYYRIVAQNSVGVTRGTIRSFTTVTSNPAPVIAALTSQVIAINSITNCSNGGTYFRVTFGFSDANGDVVFTGTPVTLGFALQPSGVSGTLNLAPESQTGNASSGTITVGVCFLFTTNTSVTITVTLRDGGGLTSNSLQLVIQRPTGANNEVDGVASVRPALGTMNSRIETAAARPTAPGTPSSTALSSRPAGSQRR